MIFFAHFEKYIYLTCVYLEQECKRKSCLSSAVCVLIKNTSVLLFLQLINGRELFSFLCRILEYCTVISCLCLIKNHSRFYIKAWYWLSFLFEVSVTIFLSLLYNQRWYCFIQIVLGGVIYILFRYFLSTGMKTLCASSVRLRVAYSCVKPHRWAYVQAEGGVAVGVWAFFYYQMMASFLKKKKTVTCISSSFIDNLQSIK